MRILELGQIIAGTYGGQVLSDLGAEVIKIESPEGDLGRNPSVAPYRGVSGLFLTFNRNKKSVVIDLKNDERASKSSTTSCACATSSSTTSARACSSG